MSDNFILRLEQQVAELTKENAALREEIKRLLKPPKTNVPGLDPEAWKAWEAYRRRLGLRPYKTTTVAEALARHPRRVQQAMVQQSIDREWRGLFEIKQQPSTASNNATTEHFL